MLLNSLILLSEKAANVARICRQNEHLFGLLVQEKGSNESNKRFLHDFKTLADVLIQEMIKHEIGRKFPALKGRVKGEENSIFCNQLGEVVDVKIQTTAAETSRLLQEVLNGDTNAAILLADEVHKDISLDDVNLCNNNIITLDDYTYDNLGIWIDPIDSTAEYISGSEIVGDGGICVTGLKCVTVLIGAYNTASGDPVIGVVNQPFFQLKDNKWHGQCHWGIVDKMSFACCTDDGSTITNNICISNSEDELVKSALRAGGFTLIEAAGAGYKMLLVIKGLADAYLLSKGSTFQWDTCGPQAILKSLGGEVVNFKEATRNNKISLMYENEDETDNEEKILKYCNTSGIIAYKSELVFQKLMQIVQKFFL